MTIEPPLLEVKLSAAIETSDPYSAVPCVCVTGGWRRSWHVSDAIVPRFPWTGDSSGWRWRCSSWCVWSSVFFHSSVTTTTDARTRKVPDQIKMFGLGVAPRPKSPATEGLSLSIYHIIPPGLTWIHDPGSGGSEGGFTVNVAFSLVVRVKLLFSLDWKVNVLFAVVRKRLILFRDQCSVKKYMYLN